jgi:penicillin-binding protein 2
MFRHGPDTQLPRNSPSLALRVTILTGISVAVLSVLALRLWYLQVLSGDDFRQQANDNRVRETRVQAPRGDILDRDGKVLVANRTVLALQVNPEDLPKPGPKRAAVMRTLEDITGQTPREIEDLIVEVRKVAPASPVILKKGLGADKAFYLRERQSSLPGVSVDRVFTREYRQGAIAAHLFGNVGEVTAEQLKQPRYSGLEQGDSVGQSGIEYEYDRFLRGRAGELRTQVDALGNPTGQLASKPASAGDSVRLTLDADLQSYAESVISSFGLPGAFVAMNVDDGAIEAMGSVPTFDPDIFSRPLTQRQYKELTSEETDAPLANRAIQGLYPTGSVFKPITAVAALKDGVVDPNATYNDTGVYTAPGDTTLKFKNASDAVFGPINMSDAFKVSADTYFYNLGFKLDKDTGRGGELQATAHQLGLGEPTGIDLPAETDGLIPSPAWRNRLYREGLTDRRWTAGDNINLAVGQGDLQADPLQMAVAYAAIANGGTVVTPHLADTVESVTGEVLQEIRPDPRREVEIPDEARKEVMNGLTRAAMEEGGTSWPVFGNFPVPVAGKTGTAERAPNPDQSWYIAVAPADDPQIVVAVTIERGGFGADAAAPVAARILEKYFKLPFTDPAGESRQATHE